MLKFFLSSLIVGAGVIIGGILSISAKEEMKKGRVYFMLMNKILFSLIILAVSLFYIKINYWVSLAVMPLFCIMLMKKSQLNLMYIAFAICYILSIINSSLYLIISSLIFFAGFSMGSVATYDLARKEIFVEKRILAAYFIFVLISSLRWGVFWIWGI